MELFRIILKFFIGRSGERGQGYPCYQRDMMMMMMIYKIKNKENGPENVKI